MVIFYSCSISFYMVSYRRRTPAGRKSASRSSAVDSRSSAVDPEPLSLVEKEAIKESLEDINMAGFTL
jgi:hypothetical protein